MTREEAHDLYRRFANPDFVELLEALDFGRAFVRARGTKLYDGAGREYTDFLAGFGVHNVGHNHPRVVAALQRALVADAPSMLNVDAPLQAGRLARRLTELTRPHLCRTAFANGGAEAVEIAIKAARSATGRTPVISCLGCYHGLTTGALSLMSSARHRRPFGPLLAGVEHVPFADVGALEQACRKDPPAAFIVEPIQAEGGVNLPPPSYLEEAERLCRSVGCLLVVDEIQTGLGRTGSWFATDFSRVSPDIILVGKALSGGMVPVAAAVMTADTWQRAFSGPLRCQLNASTFAAGHLAATAALEALSVLSDERLSERARELGDLLLEGLRGLAARHEAIRDVRGRGLLAGVELRPLPGLVEKGVPAWAREGLYAQVVSALLLRHHGFLTQPCSLAEGVLRVEPPLVVEKAEILGFVAALDSVLESCPSGTSAVWAAFRKRVMGRDL